MKIGGNGGRVFGGNGGNRWPKSFMGGNSGNGGCWKKGQKKAEAQTAGEILSLPDRPKVCLPLALDLKTIFEDSRPPWAGHGVACAL